jgi:hypothetical protein
MQSGHSYNSCYAENNSVEASLILPHVTRGGFREKTRKDNKKSFKSSKLFLQ